MEHVKLPSDCSQDDRLLAYRRDSQVQFWNDARLRLQGEYGDKQWQYLVMEADVANAFVTEVLPQRFFLTTGMLKVATTANELAVVLGHEGTNKCQRLVETFLYYAHIRPAFLVSHLILGHVSDANLFETVLRTIEVLLLSIDPTAGAISLFVIGGLAAARRALSAGNSRINELQADELGLKLAAKACFDTRQGCEVIRKMHEHKVAAQPKADSQLQLLYDTHPPTLERYERMVEQSKVDNSTGQKQCATVASRLYNAMWSSNR
jgi:Zn-dependent protease with chaperone function